MDYGLAGKHALVTGAADGCGKAIALLLAQEGVRVTLHDLPMKEALLQENAKLCGKGADYLTADLSKEEEVLALIHNAGKLDLLVNNAGIWPTAYVQDMTSDAFRKTLEINLIAPFLLAREFCNACKADGHKGKVVNMVSQAAFHGSTSGHAHYAASKAGLVGFTVSLAREVDRAREDSYLDRIPLRRIADPKEVAAAVVFLCGNQSDYITGATLDVTGGMLMR